MKPASPNAVLEVERAVSDLRRGQAVLLLMPDQDRLSIRSGEHFPEEKSVTASEHPAVKLMKHAGLLPRAVIATATEDEPFLLTVSVDSIEHYTANLADSLVKVSEAHMPIDGCEETRIIAFRPRFGHEEHLAVIIGSPEKMKAPYVRIHSSCVTGDVFGSLRCDCGSQLAQAVDSIAKAGGGAIIYLSQEGRGIGIANKLRAYALQDKGLDTVEANEALGFAADERDFALAARMLGELSLKRITLLTNNPNKIEAMRAYGIEVEKRISLVGTANPHNERYLGTKIEKLGHQF